MYLANSKAGRRIPATREENGFCHNLTYSSDCHAAIIVNRTAKQRSASRPSSTSSEFESVEK